MLVNPINSVVSYHHQHNNCHHQQPNDPVSSRSVPATYLDQIIWFIYVQHVLDKLTWRSPSLCRSNHNILIPSNFKGLVTQTRGPVILSWKISPLAVDLSQGSTPTVLRFYAILGACMIPSCARQPLALQEWFHIKNFYTSRQSFLYNKIAC